MNDFDITKRNDVYSLLDHWILTVEFEYIYSA